MNIKKIDIGQALAIIANLGVIASIVFLAVEIRQNNELLAAAASFNRFDIERERRERIMENRGGLAEIVTKRANGDALNDLETLQHRAMMVDLLESLIWQFGEVRAGRLTVGTIDADNWQTVWDANPELADLVAERRGSLDPVMLEWIERNLAAGQAEP